MKEFIETALHQKIEILPYYNMDRFPLIIRANYNCYNMKIAGQECVLVMPKEGISLSVLRRQQKKIEQITGQYCVLYLTKMNYYSRDKMLEEGISFIWENRQIYIPFLGLLLQQKDSRILPPCSKISFLTQKFLLSALYEEWDDITVTLAAEKMGVSKMSITRTFDEIESLDIPVLEKKGRFRRYIQLGTKKEIWTAIESFLRSPLLKEYYLERDLPEELMKSGISALAELSMLGDNAYPTYAVMKYDIKGMKIDKEKQIPKGENPGCIVQEIGYCIPFKNGTVIDPLTIYLLLKNEDEPRVEIALEEMLEEYVW